MKRDMDYVRELLLQVENAPAPISTNDLIADDAPHEDQAKLAYHLKMMIDEVGLVTGIDASSMEHDAWIEMKLTWQGHEYLETVRDPEVWKRTKEGAKKAGNYGMDFLVDLAKAYAKHIAKERLGVDL